MRAAPRSRPGGGGDGDTAGAPPIAAAVAAAVEASAAAAVAPHPVAAVHSQGPAPTQGCPRPRAASLAKWMAHAHGLHQTLDAAQNAWRGRLVAQDQQPDALSPACSARCCLLAGGATPKEMRTSCLHDCSHAAEGQHSVSSASESLSCPAAGQRMSAAGEWTGAKDQCLRPSVAPAQGAHRLLHAPLWARYGTSAACAAHGMRRRACVADEAAQTVPGRLPGHWCTTPADRPAVVGQSTRFRTGWHARAC